LLHQFHDILPGTSIAWVHREAVTAYGKIRDRAEAVIATATEVLAGAGDREIAFNPAPFGRHGVAGLCAAPLDRPARIDPAPRDGGFVLSNQLVTVTISAEGLITSAVDLSTGRDAIAAGQPANLLQLHQDFPNQWDAWDVDRFYRNRVADLRSVDSLRVEDGRVVIERSFSKSRVRQAISLAAGSRTLHIAQETDWHETEKFLKVAFPFDVRAEQVAAETQFGYQKRVTHTNTSWEAAKFEASMHRFVHVEEPGFGASLVTDSTYGYDLTRDSDPVHGVTTTVRLSLLRAPRFPDPETDQGVQTCAYGLVIGSSVAEATAAGLDLNLAERVVTGDHGFDPLVSVAGEGILVSSVKLADDRGGDIIVRLYESLGRRAVGTLTVNVPISEAVTVSLLERPLDDEVAVSGAQIPLSLSPFEVRTLRLTL
jgi:alpha-mannosidase